MKRTRTDEDAPTTVFIHSQQDVPDWCFEDTYNIVRFKSFNDTFDQRRSEDLLINERGELNRISREANRWRNNPYKFPTTKKRVGPSLECVVPQIVESNRVVLDNVEYRPIGLDVSNTWASKDCQFISYHKRRRTWTRLKHVCLPCQPDRTKVCLRLLNGKRITVQAIKAACIAWGKAPPECLTIKSISKLYDLDHIDGEKTHNHIDNGEFLLRTVHSIKKRRKKASPTVQWIHSLQEGEIVLPVSQAYGGKCGVSNKGTFVTKTGRMRVMQGHLRPTVKVDSNLVFFSRLVAMVHLRTELENKMQETGLSVNELQVDHIDDDPTNHHAFNLQWLTRQENLDKMKRTKPVYVWPKTRELDMEKDWYKSSAEAGRVLNISDVMIAHVCKAKWSQTKGYSCRYVN